MNLANRLTWIKEELSLLNQLNIAKRLSRVTQILPFQVRLEGDKSILLTLILELAR